MGAEEGEKVEKAEESDLLNDAKAKVKDAMENINLPKMPKVHKPEFMKKKGKKKGKKGKADKDKTEGDNKEADEAAEEKTEEKEEKKEGEEKQILRKALQKMRPVRLPRRKMKLRN